MVEAQRRVEREETTSILGVVPVRVMREGYDKIAMQAAQISSATYAHLTQRPETRRAIRGSELEQIFG
jgi:hypothetical protein